MPTYPRGEILLPMSFFLTCWHTRRWCGQHHIWPSYLPQLNKKPGTYFYTGMTAAPRAGFESPAFSMKDYCTNNFATQAPIGPIADESRIAKKLCKLGRNCTKFLSDVLGGCIQFVLMLKKEVHYHNPQQWYLRSCWGKSRLIGYNILVVVVVFTWNCE